MPSTKLQHIAAVAALVTVGCGGGSDPGPTAGGGRESVEDCILRSGAERADDPSDLAFVGGAGLGTGVQAAATAQVGGQTLYAFEADSGGWAIYILSGDGDPPSFSGVVADPSSVPFVAGAEGESVGAASVAGGCAGG